MAVHFDNRVNAQRSFSMQPTNTFRVHGRLENKEALEAARKTDSFGPVLLALGIGFVVGMAIGFKAAIITGLAVYLFGMLLNGGSSSGVYMPSFPAYPSGSVYRPPSVVVRPPVVVTPSPASSSHAVFGSRSTSSAPYVPPASSYSSIFSWGGSSPSVPTTPVSSGSHATFGARSTAAPYTAPSYSSGASTAAPASSLHSTFGARSTSGGSSTPAPYVAPSTAYSAALPSAPGGPTGGGTATFGARRTS